MPHWLNIFDSFKSHISLATADHDGEYVRLYLHTTADSEHFTLSTSVPPADATHPHHDTTVPLYTIAPQAATSVGDKLHPKVAIYRGAGPAHDTKHDDKKEQKEGEVIATLEHHNLSSDKIIFPKHGKITGKPEVGEGEEVSVNKWFEMPKGDNFPAKFHHEGHEYVWNVATAPKPAAGATGTVPATDIGKYVLEATPLPTDKETAPPLASFHPAKTQITKSSDGTSHSEKIPSFLSVHKSLLDHKHIDHTGHKHGVVKDQVDSLVDAAVLSFVVLKDKMTTVV